MKHLTATICLTLAVLLGSAGVGESADVQNVFKVAETDNSDASPHYCYQAIETALVVSDEGWVPGCQQGDTLILRIAKSVGPGPILAELCDFRYEIWTELHLPHQDTVVCVYLEKKGRW